MTRANMKTSATNFASLKACPKGLGEVMRQSDPTNGEYFGCLRWDMEAKPASSCPFPYSLTRRLGKGV